MRSWKCDLHIHSVLSPCASLEMSPRAVIQRALEEKLDIIAITDHNTMSNSAVFHRAAADAGIVCLFGVEIQTMEEIHVVGLFDDEEKAMQFDRELYQALPPIPNDPEYFGDQVVIDIDENIVRCEEKALLNSVEWDMDTTLQMIDQYGGYGFPAHVNAATYSLISQLGFIPTNPLITALGITANCDEEAFLSNYPAARDYPRLRNSDAHYLRDIDSGFTILEMDAPTIAEIKRVMKEGVRRLEPGTSGRAIP